MAADSRNRVRFGLTCLLVRTERDHILIETGVGDKLDAKHADIYGVEHSTTLLEELERQEIAPEDIDIVINTHLHFDHCGWNTRRVDGKAIPTFPRARYYVQRGEWEHALSPNDRDRVSYIPEFFRPPESQTELLEGGREIVPGIRVEVVPGHTRDMQCVWMESQGQQACFISDLVPTHHHLPYAWVMGVDLYPMETMANKKRLLPQMANQRTLVIFPHDPEMPWTTLAQQDGRIVAEAVASNLTREQPKSA
jgi:glyoxylase-like metal-dependent hydrolase (beta-lactamase superfamily II)